jgi:hypothetical protein
MIRNFNLTRDQLYALAPLFAEANRASEPGIIIAQIRETGDAKAQFIDHDTAMAVISAKQGISELPKEEREEMIMKWHKGLVK